METTNSAFEFLESEESKNYFAQSDFALRSGKHIQHVKHEAAQFEYIARYTAELSIYYFTLFGVQLKEGESPERYYYLDFDANTRSQLGKSERLSPRHTLLGLLLLKMYRVDRFFDSARISRQQFKESLKDENDDYKDEVYRLFAKVNQKADSTRIDEDNIDTWIDNSLTKFKELGWVYVDSEEKDYFEIMPSINRLFEMYQYEIMNIDKIIAEDSEELDNPEE